MFRDPARIRWAALRTCTCGVGCPRSRLTARSAALCGFGCSASGDRPACAPSITATTRAASVAARRSLTISLSDAHSSSIHCCCAPWLKRHCFTARCFSSNCSCRCTAAAALFAAYWDATRADSSGVAAAVIAWRIARLAAFDGESFFAPLSAGWDVELPGAAGSAVADGCCKRACSLRTASAWRAADSAR